MKTAEAQKSGTAQNQIQAKREPFFTKEGEGSFFSKSNEASEPFFSPTTVQPKPASPSGSLTIGQPNDKYEVEADAMADKVVQRLSDSSKSGYSPFESSTTSVVSEQKPGGDVAQKSPSTSIQPKCTTCEQEEKLQKKDDEVSENELELQRKPIFESNVEPEPEVQTKPFTSPLEGDTTRVVGEQKPGGDVSQSPSTSIQPKCTTCEQEEKLQKKEDELSENEEEIQTKLSVGDTPPLDEEENIQAKSEAAQSEASSDLQSRLHSSKGGGSPLPSDTQSSMGGTFGADFSNVRVHTDSEAVQMNKELNAQAFTHGSDIYFNEGKYDTNTNSGKHLLAHELTHTIQQGSTVKTKIQREVFGDNVRFDSIPGPPARAIALGPYTDEAIAEELYGDASVEIRHASADYSIIFIDELRLLDVWRPYFGVELVEEDEIFRQYTPEQRAQAGVFALGTALNNSAGAVEIIRNLYNNGITSIVAERARMIREILPTQQADDIIAALGNNMDRRQVVRMLSDAIPENQAAVIAERMAGMRHQLALDVRIAGGTILRKGAELVDAVRRQARPTYASLIAAGKSNASIITSATRTNNFVNRLPGGMRIAGRGLWVVSAGISIYIILDADPENRARVAREEVGAFIGGALGTAAVSSICIATGIATAGLGLVACGILGGLAGGAIGRDPYAFLQFLDMAPHTEDHRRGRLYRLQGVYDETDLFIISLIHRRVEESEHVMVIATGQVSGELVGGRGHYRNIEVTPASTAAEQLFGGTEPQWIPDYILHNPSTQDLLSEQPIQRKEDISPIIQKNGEETPEEKIRRLINDEDDSAIVELTDGELSVSTAAQRAGMIRILLDLLWVNYSEERAAVHLLRFQGKANEVLPLIDAVGYRQKFIDAVDNSELNAVLVRTMAEATVTNEGGDVDIQVILENPNSSYEDVMRLQSFASATNAQRLGLMRLLLEMNWSDKPEEAKMITILESSGEGLGELMNLITGLGLKQSLFDHIDDEEIAVSFTQLIGGLNDPVLNADLEVFNRGFWGNLGQGIWGGLVSAWENFSLGSIIMGFLHPIIHPIDSIVAIVLQIEEIIREFDFSLRTLDRIITVLRDAAGFIVMWLLLLSGIASGIAALVAAGVITLPASIPIAAIAAALWSYTGTFGIIFIVLAIIKLVIDLIQAGTSTTSRELEREQEEIGQDITLLGVILALVGIFKGMKWGVQRFRRGAVEPEAADPDALGETSREVKTESEKAGEDVTEAQERADNARNRANEESTREEPTREEPENIPEEIENVPDETNRPPREEQPREEPAREEQSREESVEQRKPCFVKGTKIITAAGVVPIEKIKVNDRALTRVMNSDSNLKPYRVEHIKSGQTPELYQIFIDKESVICTPNHFFATKNKGWVPAKYLNEQDELETADGSIKPTSILKVIPKQSTTVYNFTVEEVHTYFVAIGKHTILVHNDKPFYDPEILWFYDDKMKARDFTPNSRGEVNPDLDGKSVWETNSRVEAEEWWHIRRYVQGRSSSSRHSWIRTSQLAEFDLVAIETPGNGAHAEAGFKHYSIRPVENPDPTIDLTEAEINTLNERLAKLKAKYGANQRVKAKELGC